MKVYTLFWKAKRESLRLTYVCRLIFTIALSFVFPIKKYPYFRLKKNSPTIIYF